MTTKEKATPLLSARDISKEFGYRKVLNNININLYKGRLNLLLGKNGAGKSTLMKILTGLSRPSSGEVLYRDKNIIEAPIPFRRSIGFITHQSNFYSDLTAKENLVFAAKLQKKKGINTATMEALKQTGLAKFADVRVKIFSSGMMKRLNIARLMLLKPEILLLDEPYTGLDYDSTAFFNRFLKSFKDQGGAILMISHQIETCFDISDDIIILENRSILQSLESESLTCEQLLQEYHHLTA